LIARNARFPQSQIRHCISDCANGAHRKYIFRYEATTDERIKIKRAPIDCRESGYTSQIPVEIAKFSYTFRAAIKINEMNVQSSFPG